MRIYFAGAIRGGRDETDIYKKIITYLSSKAEVLTEHVGSSALTTIGETNRSDREIFMRDMEWLQSADLIIAEVTTPSLGVGYELGIAEKLNIPVLCLYRPIKGKRLSAMLSGNEKFNCEAYQTFDEAKIHINKLLK
jgi:nucleoside 2-deoxyribosyltransferase